MKQCVEFFEVAAAAYNAWGESKSVEKTPLDAQLLQRDLVRLLDVFRRLLVDVVSRQELATGDEGAVY